jgi:ribokinase
MNHKIQMLAVGDVVTDAFIKLLPHEAEIEHDAKRHPLLCMTYGTKVPYQEEIEVPGVGNAANAAVASSKLGLHTAFLSDVGSDEIGEKIIHSLHNHKVSTEFIHVHMGMHSNYHYVLWYGTDRTILIKHETYPYKWPEINEYQKPEWIYLSSIAENGTAIHAGLAEYLKSNSDVKFAFQPGTFQIREGRAKLEVLYKNCSIFAANKEEFAQILGISSTNEKELIAKMHKLGPKTVLLTDGPKGAFASDGNKVVFMPPYPDIKPPLDRTGAGDAYASTFTATVATGHSLEDALAWAGVNAMSVCQQVGAQAGLLSASTIKRYLAEAPASYKTKEM